MLFCFHTGLRVVLLQERGCCTPVRGTPKRHRSRGAQGPQPFLPPGLRRIPPGQSGQQPLSPTQHADTSFCSRSALSPQNGSPGGAKVSYRRGAKRLLAASERGDCCTPGEQRCIPRPGHVAQLPEEHTAFPFLPFSLYFPIFSLLLPLFSPPAPPASQHCWLPAGWQSPPWGQDFPRGYTNCPCGYRISPVDIGFPHCV